MTSPSHGNDFSRRGQTDACLVSSCAIFSDSSGKVLRTDRRGPYIDLLPSPTKGEDLGSHLDAHGQEGAMWPGMLKHALERARSGRFTADGWCLDENRSRFTIRVSRVGSENPCFLVMMHHRHLTAGPEPAPNLGDLFESLPVALLLLDPSDQIVWSNRALSKLTGFERDELLGQRFGPMLSPGTRARGSRSGSSDTHLTDPAGLRDLRRKSGQRFKAEIRSVVAGTGQAGAGTLLAITDVTEHILAREELVRVSAELDQTRDITQHFFARLSHDFRTRLTAILGFADLLRGQVGGDLADFAQLISESAEDLCRSMDDLVDYSWTRVGPDQSHPTVTDAARMLRNEIDHRSSQAVGLGIHFHVSTPESSAIETDEAALRRIVNILLDNLLQVSSPGVVSVRLTDSEAGVELSFQDNGPGIEPEDLPDLFEPFRPASVPRATARGLGLGLSIAKRLATHLGGRIVVHSQPGAGSLFSLVLPHRWSVSPAANPATQ